MKVFNLVFSIDILLHQSGHIMLSDFDLAKQSNEPNTMPRMVRIEQNGVGECSLGLE